MSLEALSRREHSILELIAQGLSNEGIAERLNLSLKTVEGATRSIFLKLGLGTPDPAENRRVKAALRYLEAFPAPRSSALASGRVRSLVTHAPFDTIARALEQEAAAASQRSWVLTATAAWFSTISEDFLRAGALARRSVDLADADPLGQQVAPTLAMMLDAFQGTAPLDHERLDQLALLLLGDDPFGDELIGVVANLEIPNWYTFADRAHEGAAILDRALHAGPLDDHATIALLGCRVELELRRGRWALAAATLDDLGDRSAAVGAATGYVDALAARLAAARGDDATVEATLRRSRVAGLNRGDRSTLWRADAAECLHLLGRGDLHAAALATSLVDQHRRSGLRLASVRWSDLDVVEALGRADRREEAEAAALALGADAEATGSEWAWAMHRAALGFLRADGECLAEASRRFEALDAPFERARCELLAAEASTGIDRVTATASARRAATVFAALGASRWEARARRLAHVQG